MNKKIRIAAVVVISSILFGSCAANGAGGHVQSTTTGVQDVIASRVDAEGNSGSSEAGPDNTTDSSAAGPVSDSECDIDLTTMNSDLVYANVFGILSEPDGFIGTTIRITGTAVSHTDETTGETYYACFITDAAACCSSGFEYELADGGTYPADGTEITVLGTFNIYEDGGARYALLENSVIEG
ncbi:hypothetical protein SAMN06296952_0646 [Oscillospiraceae bacterium]|nr:hypothetical protein SAMN06296952_0646 [Oscillospiraceae bacterium]